MNHSLRALLFVIAGIFITSNSYSQKGGTQIYSFLNLPNSARIAALGYNFVAIDDQDVSVGLNNPSLIVPEMHNDVSLSFIDYYTDINYGVLSYSRTFEKVGSLAGSVQYINYGSFDYTDETGEMSGTFTGGEYAVTIGWGRKLDSLFSIGANLKAISSTFETYNSFGLAVDVAASYHRSSKGFVMSLIARNIGRQLTTYVPGNTENLPLEIQFGLSKKIEHLPFRYSVLLTNLQKWDLTYDDPDDDNIDPFTGEEKKQSKVGEIADKAMRHVVLGGEFMPSKNFSILLGYNYQRRQELKIDTKRSTVGFSWGFGFKISRFNFSYARSAYHLAGSPNFITVGMNFK